jgi:hypothetical protein
VTFTATFAITWITVSWRIKAASRIAAAHFAAVMRESIIIRHAFVTFVTVNAWLAATFAHRITLLTHRTISMTITVQTFIIILSSIKAMLAILTIETFCVSFTIDTYTTMTS